MTTIRVTGFTCPLDPAAAQRGVLGYFNCEIGPVRMVGCKLKLTEAGPAVLPPSCHSKLASITVCGDEVRDRLVAAAVSALEAMGGRVPESSP